MSSLLEIFCSNLLFGGRVSSCCCFKRSDWQPWIWHLFTTQWVMYSESYFTNVGNDLRVYLTLLVNNCSGKGHFLNLVVLQSESPSGISAKLHTVAASNNRDYMPWSLYYCLFAPHICGVFLRTRPVHGESHI